MSSHAPHRLVRRLLTDPIPAPTGFAGITNSAITVGTGMAASATGLAVDSNAVTNSQTAPALGITFTPVTTLSASTVPTQTSSPDRPSVSVQATSGSSSPIPINTVIGSCVAAFIGMIALIVFALWMYRRYANSLNKSARSRLRSSIAGIRGALGQGDRRRSRRETWDKLGDGEDKWESMDQKKEVDNVAPMEKLTMFKKRSPSVRTAYTQKSEEPHAFDAQPSYAHLQSSHTQNGLTSSPLPYLGQVDTGAPISWDAVTSGNNSYFSLQSNVSPTLTIAIPTPPATSSAPHRWESAEVVHVDESQDQQRHHYENPFFNSQSRRSTDMSSVRRGKQRARSLSNKNPFSDENTRAGTPASDYDVQMSDPPLPRPLGGVANHSRAIQSLIEVLDAATDDMQGQGRVNSLQASVYSTVSNGDDDMTKSFPLPPTTKYS